MSTLSAELELPGAAWSGLGCRVEVLVTDHTDLLAARHAVEEVIDEVDRTFSRFREDSELEALNRSPDPDVTVSPLLAQALQVAIDAARWTEGSVDPTIGGHLLDLGYDRTFSTMPKDGPALTAVSRPPTSFRALRLEQPGAGPALLHRPPGTRLDLGATGKGLAADLAADTCATAGVRGVLVNLGGDISVSGEPPVDGWPVFVTDDSTTPAPQPRPSDAVLPDGAAAGQTVALLGGALATSGTTRRRWRRGGVPVHHIIDPATGVSAAGPWRTVSVAASTCVLANAAATAAVVRGPHAVAWLSGTGLAARLVASSGDVVRLGSWPE